MANKGSFIKGVKKPNQGKRGPDKNKRHLREMILQALNEQEGGGVAYLKIQAVQNPVAFMSLLGKVLPMQVEGPDGEHIFEKIVVEVIDGRQ